MPKMIEPTVGTRAVRTGGPSNGLSAVHTVVTALTKTLIVTEDGERYRKSDHRNRSSRIDPYSISFEGEDDFPRYLREAEEIKRRRMAKHLARNVLDKPDDPDTLEYVAQRLAGFAGWWRNGQQ